MRALEKRPGCTAISCFALNVTGLLAGRSQEGTFSPARGKGCLSVASTEGRQVLTPEPCDAQRVLDSPEILSHTVGQAETQGSLMFRIGSMRVQRPPTWYLCLALVCSKSQLGLAHVERESLTQTPTLFKLLQISQPLSRGTDLVAFIKLRFPVTKSTLIHLPYVI